MTRPGATADTGLPIAAGRSIPRWNVPASGRSRSTRDPNGDDTQAGSTGGSSTFSDRCGSAARGAGARSPKRTAIGAILQHQHLPRVLKLLTLFAPIRLSAKRSGTPADCLISNMCKAPTQSSPYRAAARLSFRVGVAVTGGVTSSGLLSAAISASRNCLSFRSFSTFRPKTSFT